MNKKTKTISSKEVKSIKNDKVELSSNKNFSFLKLYLMLVSIVGIIGTAVCVGIVLYQTLTIKLITNEEYIQGQGYYELDVCNTQPYNYNYAKENIPVLNESGTNVETNTWTDVDIKKCKDEKTETLILRRYANMKEALIGAISSGFVFFVLFITHFPFFIKKDRNR